MSLDISSYKRWVIKNIAFNLQKITVANGYHIDILAGSVEIGQRELHTIASPAIIVTPLNLRRNYMVGQQMEFFLEYAIVPVIDKSDACVSEAEDMVEALDAFELDVIACHHDDLFLHTAFSTNPNVPSELQTFYLRDHKLGTASYVYTLNRAYLRQEGVAEYELAGQQNI